MQGRGDGHSPGKGPLEPTQRPGSLVRPSLAPLSMRSLCCRRGERSRSLAHCLANSDLHCGPRPCVKSRVTCGALDVVVATLSARLCPFSRPLQGPPRACPVHLLRIACRCAQLWSLARTLPLARSYTPSAECRAGLGGGPLRSPPRALPFWGLAQGHGASCQDRRNCGTALLFLLLHAPRSLRNWASSCCWGSVPRTEHHSCNFPAPSPPVSRCCLE